MLGLGINKILTLLVGLAVAWLLSIAVKKMTYRLTDNARTARMVGWTVLVIVALAVAAFVLSDVV